MNGWLSEKLHMEALNMTDNKKEGASLRNARSS
jgi:hypothetical protein